MTAFPAPKPAQIIRYEYLWEADAKAGREEGGKTRPVVVVLAAQQDGDRLRVIVAPITHDLSPPTRATEWKSRPRPANASASTAAGNG